MKKGYIAEAIILAIGIIVLGFNIKGGIDKFVDKDGNRVFLRSYAKVNAHGMIG